LQIVTKTKPSQHDTDAMLFAWRVLKHIKSNGILIAKHDATVGIGAGQVSRIDAVDMAVRKASDSIQDAVLASDAFFPFRDSIDRIANSGIRAIIQPGGSVRDEEVIAACDEHGIAMVFTGKRCFKH
jgi:phosphoribosylaminoimidazolecarboxamide formyltransferase/IMP cyclohydrolase